MFKNLQKVFSVSPCYLLLTVLSACSNTSVSYVDMYRIETSPTEPKSVEVIYDLPSINAIHLGNIIVNGNGFTGHQDIINAAKEKAGEIGANYIFCIDSGIEKKTVVDPGYSSYQTNRSAYFTGNQNSIYGSTNHNSSGYSGSSANTFYCPWSIFSAWISKPSKTGICLNDDHIVIGFHLNSDAELAGIKIGDKVIGIDGIDINDRALIKHFMNMQPGSKCAYTVSRNEERKIFTIITLPNE